MAGSCPGTVIVGAGGGNGWFKLQCLEKRAPELMFLQIKHWSQLQYMENNEAHWLKRGRQKQEEKRDRNRETENVTLETREISKKG